MEDKLPIVVANALCQIDIRVMLFSLNILELGSQHRDIIVSFKFKADVVRAVQEAASSPCKLT